MSQTWVETGARIAGELRRLQWQLAAWWAHRPQDSGLVLYGAAVSGLSHHHLAKMARIYEAYAVGDIVNAVSFSHHESAALLPPDVRLRLLQRAAGECLTLDEFRGLVRKEKEKTNV